MNPGGKALAMDGLAFSQQAMWSYSKLCPAAPSKQCGHFNNKCMYYTKGVYFSKGRLVVMLIRKSEMCSYFTNTDTQVRIFFVQLKKKV